VDPNRPGVSVRGRATVANSLVVYRDNRFLDYYDKRLLPTYDVFDEDRYFEPGDRTVVIASNAPSAVRNPQSMGLAICEDLWKGEDAGFSSRYYAAPDPVASLIEAGANVILSPSASPFVLGKGEKHRAILRHHALRHRVYVASVNQLGGNDDLVFDGHAFVYGPDGELLAAGRGFSDEQLIVDLPASAGPRSGSGREACVLFDVPDRLLFEALTLGIRDYLRKTGHKQAIIGISGGIDSAVTAALAAAALGPANVLGVSMPSRYSSEGSRTDAYDLAKRLRIGCQTVPIEPPFVGFREILDPAFRAASQPTLGQTMPDITEENLQSRLRGTLLMAISNRTGGLVLTTGNKSELAVGYCTLYGDTNGGLAVLSDVTKLAVYRLARWMNANFQTCGFDTPPIPEGTLTKPASAELRPGQKTEECLPPYVLIDQIIERYIEQHQSAARIAQETRIDPETVRRIVRMIDTAEYKRKQTAVGLKVTTVAFGAGRRMPIAQRWSPSP
jgi:NAD+ synthase/NAD+ synthase (glutamine-hydrolysing)